MSGPRKVLIVDDQAGEIDWLIRRIRARGYGIVLATNERSAKEALAEMARGDASYVAGIFDIMVAVEDLQSLIELGDEADFVDDFFARSADTGIRLCEYVRRDLGLSRKALPICALSVRDDDDVKRPLRKLGVKLYQRDAEGRSRHSIVEFLDRYVPLLEDDSTAD